jgi:AraC family transcriptional regulator
MTKNQLRSSEPNPESHKTLILSSRHLGWNGILVEQYQYSPDPSEVERPALSDHWLNLPLGYPVCLAQKRDGQSHESIVRQGNSIFVPAGQSSYWRCPRGETSRPTLHIYLSQESIVQVAKASEIDADRVNLINCFSKPDSQLHQIAMLLLSELRSGGIMGQLYAESLTQVLVIHLLRHYSTSTQTLISKSSSLTPVQFQEAIEYIHAHLDRDLSLAELARVVNISPTYFAGLFKQLMGISPHQYVIQQRVEQAKLMLSKTDLAIADIALRVGFSSQSHLTQQFKRFTGVTPKQIR